MLECVIMPEKSHNFFLLFLQTCMILWVINKFQFESADFSMAIQVWIIGALVSWILPKKIKWLILVVTTIIGLYLIKQIKILPIFGSIFTLRLILYVIELKKNPNLWGWKETISYFLMLPNFTLYIFPLISYEAFCNGLRSEAKIEIYKKGFHFIAIGALQLLLWKIIRFYFYFPFEKVHSVGEFSLFLILNFLLYIRISGSFHMIVGVLGLYGIDLPRVNNFYLFSTGFSDFWRRINIYFRDFVIKFIFHPCYFYLKKYGHRKSFFTSIILVLFGSWFLHGAIYLFIFGKFRITVGESIFWIIWGLAIFISAYREEKYKPKKISLGKEKKNVFYALFFKITVFSFVLTFLWSISTTDDIKRFLTSFLFLQWRGFSDLSWVLIFPLIGLFGAIYRGYFEGKNNFISEYHGVIALGSLLAFLFFSPEEFKDLLAGGTNNSNLSDESLNRIQNRDYYSGLQTTRASEIIDQDRDYLLGEKILLDAQDFRDKIWNKKINSTFLGHKITTNSWGMIDHEYLLQKPKGAIRLAVLGSCVSMPWAIDQGLEWPKQAERILNQVIKDKYEIMNFSVPGYSLPNYPIVAELEISKFKPDYLILEVVAGAISQSGYVISRALKKKLSIPYPEIYNTLGIRDPKSFVAQNYPEELSPEASIKIATLSLKKLSEIADKMNAKVILVIMPSQLKEQGMKKEENHDALYLAAQKNNFKIIDLSKDFDNKNIGSLIIKDDNLTREGHAIIGGNFVNNFVNSR